MWQRILLALGLAWGLICSLNSILVAQAEELDFPGVENWDATIGAVNLTRTVHSLAFDDSFLYIGEGFGSDLTGRHIRRWNGDQWASIASNVNGPVTALYADGSGILYAGGNFTQIGTCNSSCNRIATWNGSAWSALGSGTTGEVLAIVKDTQGNLYAGGDFGVKRWNGSSWDSLSGLPETNTIFDMVISDTLHVAGWFYNEDDEDIYPLLKSWNGSTWENLDSEFSNSNGSSIFALALLENQRLIAGGDFFSPHRNLAYQGETSWQTLGDPNLTVQALAVDTCGGLYVGGQFTQIGGKSIPHLAYWDQSNWYSLADTTSQFSSIEALAFRDGYLAVGGEFTQTFGTNRYHNIALWTGRDCATITATGRYTFYDWRHPVVIEITEPGNLAEIRVQRFNKNHPGADEITTPNLRNGIYWQIEGVDMDGQPASGFVYTLTLPTVGFTPDEKDKICHYDSVNKSWDCAASTYDPVKKTITRSGLTSFSEFTVGNDVGPTAVNLKSLTFKRHNVALIVWWLIILIGGWIVYRNTLPARGE